VTDPEALIIQWQHHKNEEVRHMAARRAIEDELVKHYKVPHDLDGTSNHTAGNVAFKLVGRLDRKVDAEKVQELAAEHGMDHLLSALFRWKPELNMRAWAHADEKVRKALEPAITTKPGRPSFQVVDKQDR
jgi:Ser-tRNA(Ala) deacylase AlaX